MESIRLIVMAQGLCLQFRNLEEKDKFIDDMEHRGIDFFLNAEDRLCYIKHYSKTQSTGVFVSKEGRLGLVFASSEDKFFFKERIALASDCILDLGRGYEAQLHFNEAKLPCQINASLDIEQRTTNPYDASWARPALGISK